MSRAEIVDALGRLGADGWHGGDALAWARSLPEDVAAEAAWAACGRGDWMLRVLGAMHREGRLPRAALVLGVCAAARVTLGQLEGLAGRGAAVAAVEAAARWRPGDPGCERDRARAHALVWLYASVDTPARREGAAPAVCAAACAADCAAAGDDVAAAYAADDSAVACLTAAGRWASGAQQARQLAEVADAIRAAVPWRVVAEAAGRGCAP